MAYCTKCGDSLEESNLFCTKCGKQVKTSSTISPDHSNLKQPNVDTELNESDTVRPLPRNYIKKCPFCQEEILASAIKCKYCQSMLNDIENPKTEDEAGYTIIEGLKAPNTPCLWLSLNYWNLYFSKDGVVAARCYVGKWGLIGFIIGLFMAVIGFIIVGGLGILLDKSNGEANCRLMRDKLNDILSNPKKYHIVQASWNEVNGPLPSDLCLGNIWLKYKITILNKDLYLEAAKYVQIVNTVGLYGKNIS